MKTGQATVVALCGLASVAAARPIDGVFIKPRIFNDFPSSHLVITNNYPTEVTFAEDNFGSGGFANRHAAYFSTDGGATPHDFNYGDGFDVGLTLDLDATPPQGREAGFHSDLFGFGFFGVLPNGEIAAFGSILPFKTFGNVWTPGLPAELRMTYTPGDGEGVGAPSTIEYSYNLGGGWVSSGLIPFTNAEQGIPSGGWDCFIGFGVQNQGSMGGSSVAKFTNIKVPAPAAIAPLAALGLAGLRRRR